MRILFRFVLIPLLVIVLFLAGLGMWIQGGSKADPAASIPTSFDETPFRIYEAVVPDSPLRLMHFVSETNEVNVSSSLIMGEREVIVFAAQATWFAAARLADEIEATGLELTYVYLGHPHLDHSQGAVVLKERFPNARFVAAPKVADLQQLRMEGDDERAVARFGDNAAVPSVPFEPLDSDVLMIEGREIQLWHGQIGDAGIGYEDEPHTVAYIPDLAALLPNDICYFDAHMMMGGSTAASRALWKDQLRSYQDMDLQVIIPGHVPRGSTAEMTPEGVLEHSLSYIEAYEAALDANDTSDAVIAEMLERYPGMEHTSALYMGTYINFRETHRLLFNPRLEAVASVLPKPWVRSFDERMFKSTQERSN